MSEYERNLQRFSDLDDVEVAEDDPDVRGWDVRTRDGRDIGEVKDLLVDTRTMKVRCLEVELDKDNFNWNDNRRVAIPLDSVQLDEDHDDVVVRGMALDEIGRLEEYRPGTFTAGREGIREGERITRSEEELDIGKRDVRAGEVRVGKHVESEHVSQPVSRERDRVSVERRPASDPSVRSAGRFEDQEIRVPVTEEEVVVEKRPIVKEEVVVRKDRVTDTENVEADLRKERVDVEKQGRIRDENDKGRGRGR